MKTLIEQVKKKIEGIDKLLKECSCDVNPSSEDISFTDKLIRRREKIKELLHKILET